MEKNKIELFHLFAITPDDSFEILHERYQHMEQPDPRMLSWITRGFRILSDPETRQMYLDRYQSCLDRELLVSELLDHLDRRDYIHMKYQFINLLMPETSFYPLSSTRFESSNKSLAVPAKNKSDQLADVMKMATATKEDLEPEFQELLKLRQQDTQKACESYQLDQIYLKLDEFFTPQLTRDDNPPDLHEQLETRIRDYHAHDLPIILPDDPHPVILDLPRTERVHYADNLEFCYKKLIQHQEQRQDIMKISYPHDKIQFSLKDALTFQISGFSRSSSPSNSDQIINILSLDDYCLSLIFAYLPRSQWIFIRAAHPRFRMILKDRLDLTKYFSRPLLQEQLNQEHQMTFTKLGQPIISTPKDTETFNHDYPQLQYNPRDLFWTECSVSQIQMYNKLLNPHCLSWCALVGNLDGIHYIYDNSIYVQKTIEDQKHRLQIKDPDPDHIDATLDRDDWSIDPCLMSVYGGHLEILQDLQQHGFRLTASLCVIAARQGHTKCLDYLMKNNCHSDGDAIYAWTIRFGHVDCLRLLLEKRRHDNMGWPPIHMTLSNWSIVWDQVGCLQLLLEYDPIPFDPIPFVHLCEFAVKHGSLHCLDYLHSQQNNILEDDLCLTATTWGQVETLDYLLKHGCHLRESLCTLAVEHQQFACLKYLYAKGCRGDLETCRKAIQNDDLECLQFLIDHQCPCNVTLLQIEPQQGHYACHNYLRKIFSPVDPQMIRRILPRITNSLLDPIP